MSDKLQKALARAGLGSRRAIEGWIRAGRISINGQVAEIGARVDPRDEVRVDGRRVSMPDPERALRVLMYHKPAGEICTRADPEGRPTVFDRLPKLRGERWVAVGRLDVSTIGLLLFTNDGELAHRLMHPSTGVEREYAVRLRGRVTKEILERLRRGVALDDGLAKFDAVEARGGEGSNQWFHVTIGEGRNREVRRLWESQGLEVSRLIRVRYGPVSLPRQLQRGRFAPLKPTELDKLCRLAGREAPPAAARAPRGRRPAPRRRPARAGRGR